LRILLGVSLALNLLVLGLVTGAMLRFGGPHGMRMPPRSLGSTMIREMPRQDRHAMREQAFGDPASRRDHRRVGAAAMSAALRAVPFDREALHAVVSEQARHREAVQASVQAAWLARVDQMSDAERAAYADRLQHAQTKTRRWHMRD